MYSEVMRVWSAVASLTLLVCIAELVAQAPPAGGQRPTSAVAQAPTATEATPWAHFLGLVNDYIKMRDRVRQELPGLVVTEKPAEYIAASDALARAIERAEPNAPQGRFFSAQTAAEIRRRIDDYGRKYDLTEIATPEPDERSTVGNVNVYTRFPMASPMASMPPGLLAALPPLPASLEYRLVGRMLILRDVDAALILDYLPNAVTAIK